MTREEMRNRVARLATNARPSDAKHIAPAVDKALGDVLADVGVARYDGDVNARCATCAFLENCRVAWSKCFAEHARVCPGEDAIRAFLPPATKEVAKWIR